jgi:dipeptidyl aminopeptidase/acylaminoacyl peptidase
MKKLFIILLCLFLTATLWSQKRALNFEDMFAAGRLSSPAVSPDGKWVVFAVKIPDIAANTFQTDLYAADLQGRSLKKLTDGKGNHSNPRFLRSGLLTFVSSRGGDPQVFSMDLRNPAVVTPVTKVAGGVGDFIWSSDEKSIAFARDVDPRAKTFAEAVAMEKETENSKVKAKLLTALLFRVWDSWRDGKRSHVFLHRPGTSEFADLTPGEFDTPPLDLGGSQDYIFSSDGAWFAYVKNTDPVVAISTNNDVYLRSLKNGQEKNISADNRGGDANPVLDRKSVV